MSWNVAVKLKSGESQIITIKNLISVDKFSISDGSPTKITDFNKFYLSANQHLSFIGEDDTLNLISNEVEYVLFSKN
jgi:hypothetical protein